jgi:sulfur carrier protein
MITVFIEPDNETLAFERLNTVLMLQKRLGLRVNDALVIRGPQLLTPDCRLEDGDEILIRKVTSTG